MVRVAPECANVYLIVIYLIRPLTYEAVLKGRVDYAKSLKHFYMQLRF